MTTINIIVCASQNGVIGDKGELIYKFKEDMDYFVKATTGHTVAMGRKTWESIPEKFRPLKDRVNLILSKTPQQSDHPAVFYYEGIQPVLDMVKTGAIQGDLWVIGGSAIYEAFLPHADVIHVTAVNEDAEGDTRFIVNAEPNSRFELASISTLRTDAKTGKTFTFQTYKRIYHDDEYNHSN